MKFLKNEDWLSLIAGCLIIGLAIAGVTVVPIKLKLGNINFFDTSIIIGSYFILSYLVSLPLIGLYKPGFIRHFLVFTIVFLIAIVSIFLSSINEIKNLGLEYVIFSLLLGIGLRNLVRLPDFFIQNSYSEYFVKTGLVLLGASVIFGDILKAGSLGLVQALVVVIAVWYVAYWLGSKLKIDEELKLMIASAVSICGVSAAIATSGAIKGDSKKLSYVVSLVLIVALPMLIFMPMIAKAIGLSDQVAGAWLGGTIDTTGAVVASGELLGAEALKYSTVVKFSQNILLGIAALAISVFWSLQNKKDDKSQKVDIAIIWERFPKFVLGFVAISLLYSFGLNSEIVAATKDYLKSFQTLLFAIAFVFIGLETDFKALLNTGQGKPAIVFIVAQGFNIFFTLLVSWLLFR